MPQLPHETVWQLATATVASRTLHVVAELGVADHIADTPVPTKELAAACGAEPEALERALLLLAAHSVFKRTPEGFAHTDASRLLRSDHPMSMRAFPRMMGMAAFTASFAQLDYAVRTGRPAFELVSADGLFAHLQRHPDEARIFDASMTGKAAGDIAAVLAAYDFSRFTTIADIGGGRGHLLRAVLDTVPSANGILFDLPDVVASLDLDADQLAQQRLSLHGGDFFADKLPNADLYILMEVIHDWGTAQAASILSAVAEAAPPGATVLIIEAVVEDKDPDPVVHTLDMIMLAITGGRERTAAELSQLLHDAGLSATAVLTTPGVLRIVEAVKNSRA